MRSIPFIFLLFLLAACGASPESSSDTQDPTSPPVETTEEVADRPTKEAPENSAKAHFASMDVRNIGPEESAVHQDVEQARSAITEDGNPLTDYWTGQFGPNRITLILSEVSGEEASGHSVCAGNYRPISGTYYIDDSGNYNFLLEEPGDDRYDGTFDFSITIEGDKRSLQGKWTSFDEQGNRSKNYTLKPRTFVYRPEVGEFPEASQRLLDYEYLENFHPEDLRRMRNEIYARHGYCFKIKDMRYTFEERSWYMPVSTDIRDELTDTEVANIQLIYEYETYYDEYYDEFGR